MLEEPTIRKAGVVASQKRHLGRTIATGPLPFTRAYSARSVCSTELGIKVIPIPFVASSAKVKIKTAFNFKARSVIEYSNVQSSTVPIKVSTKPMFGVRNVIGRSYVNSSTKIGISTTLSFIVERKVVITGIREILTKASVSATLEVKVNDK